MANGALLPALPAAADPIGPSTSPHAGDQSDRIVIGDAMADAVIALGAALIDFEAAGAMSPATKDAGGSRIARVVEMQLAASDETDFVAAARAEGRHTLLRRHGAALRQRFGAISETAIDGLVDEVLVIVSRVCAHERALAH